MPHDQAHPVFIVYRYDDVLEVLRDGETFSSAHIIELIMGDVMGKYILVGMDNPGHRRYRALVSTGFRRGALARWEAELIQPVASDLVDRFAGRGRAELVREFTARLREHAAHEVAERGITPAEAARHAGISWPVVHEAFTAAAGQLLGQPAALVPHLGIDEHRRGKAADWRVPSTLVRSHQQVPSWSAPLRSSPW